MIGLCLKCLYIFELRKRYQEYWDKNGFSHRSKRRCPKCRSTKLNVRKSFKLNDMKYILKRIEEGDFESVMEPIKVVKPPKSKSRKPPGPKSESEYVYCFYTDWCEDPKQDLREDTHYCSNQDREKCYNKAKKKYRETKLTSGHIEEFHRLYRQFKEHQLPNHEPSHDAVKRWLKITDHQATELLEKHIPKEYRSS